MTEEELSALYDECNQTRFGGELPKVRVSWGEPGDGLAGSYKPNSAFGRSIWISRIWTIAMDKSRIREVLLHEMCHVAACEADTTAVISHGPLFRGQLVRLYEQGETWALEDIERCEEWARLEALAFQVSNELNALANVNPLLPWLAVRGKLVAALKCSVADLRQAAPWAKEAWYRYQRNVKGKRT